MQEVESVYFVGDSVGFCWLEFQVGEVKISDASVEIIKDQSAEFCRGFSFVS